MKEENTNKAILLTAAEAYMESTVNKYKCSRQRLKPIIEQINIAIKQGKYSTSTYANLSDVDIEYLVNYGYKVEANKYNNSVKISWEKV